MKKQVGLVIVNAIDVSSVEDLHALLDEGRLHTSEGRNLVLVWEPLQEWRPTLPIEGLSTQYMLGAPSYRKNSKWEFAGNGAVRFYRAKRSQKTVPERTIQWVWFRLSGEKAYTRRHSVTKQIFHESTLETTHPVFTRDVANNVWHLPLRAGFSGIIKRLQALLTWSDEVTLVLQSNGKRRLPYRKLKMDDCLVPRAEKTPYFFTPVD
tara:strand:+ start:178 stop:801 length:624 start_codon:yes stop_codon:yes gene_type:complete